MGLESQGTLEGARRSHEPPLVATLLFGASDQRRMRSVVVNNSINYFLLTFYSLDSVDSGDMSKIVLKLNFDQFM
jgi:hypothetical protein